MHWYRRLRECPAALVIGRERPTRLRGMAPLRARSEAPRRTARANGTRAAAAGARAHVLGALTRRCALFAGACSPPLFDARARSVTMGEELRAGQPSAWADVPFRGGVVRVSRLPLPPALDAVPALPPLSSSPDAFEGFAMPGLDSMELSEQDEAAAMQARWRAHTPSRRRGNAPARFSRPERAAASRAAARRRRSRLLACARALRRSGRACQLLFPAEWVCGRVSWRPR